MGRINKVGNRRLCRPALTVHLNGFTALRDQGACVGQNPKIHSRIRRFLSIRSYSRSGNHTQPSRPAIAHAASSAAIASHVSATWIGVTPSSVVVRSKPPYLIVIGARSHRQHGRAIMREAIESSAFHSLAGVRSHAKILNASTAIANAMEHHTPAVATSSECQPSMQSHTRTGPPARKSAKDINRPESSDPVTLTRASLDCRRVIWCLRAGPGHQAPSGAQCRPLGPWATSAHGEVACSPRGARSRRL